MFTIAFWKGCIERAVKTFTQALAAFLIANVTGILDVDWKTALSVSLMAPALSALTSLGSVQISPKGSPSLVNDRPAD